MEIDDEVIVSDYFHPGGRADTGVRADTITTLVVEVPTPERVAVDAAELPEHSDEAKDVLTKLREGTWIPSLRLFYSTPQPTPDIHPRLRESTAGGTQWHSIQKLPSEAVL